MKPLNVVPKNNQLYFIVHVYSLPNHYEVRRAYRIQANCIKDYQNLRKRFWENTNALGVFPYLMVDRWGRKWDVMDMAGCAWPSGTPIEKQKKRREKND